jgi:hypothetical protein
MKTKTSNYTPVSNNIYFDGNSYRVRVTLNGVRTSKNFESKKKAIQYRNQLLKEVAQ